MEKEKLIQVIARHIYNNWNASLGYGEDKKIISKACDDFDWLLNAMEITTEDILKEVSNLRD